MVYRPSEEELNTFRSAGATIDPLTRTVTQPSGTTARVEPKAMEVLLFLRSRAGAVTSKQQLIDEVWEGRFVTEDVVTVTIYALRQALGDDAKHPTFIETVHRRGYRWIGPTEGTGTVMSARGGQRWGGVSAPAVALAAGVAFVIGVVATTRSEPDVSMPTIEVASAIVKANARGEFFATHRTVPDLERAIAEYERAIALDDRFAEPHAGLAQACLTLGEYIGDPDGRLEAKARAAASRAMELAPNLAIAQAAAAGVAFGYDRDMAAAEAMYRHALASDPALPLVHRKLGLLLSATGDIERGVRHLERGVELAPTSSAAHAELGAALMLRGDLDDAERILQEALVLDSANVDAMLTHGFVLELSGREQEAYASYRGALSAFGYGPDELRGFDDAFETEGLRGMHRTWLEALKAADGPVSAFAAAFVAARANQDDDAIDLLEEAIVQREPSSPWIAVHPAFRELHGRPEFARLVRQAGLRALDGAPVTEPGPPRSVE